MTNSILYVNEINKFIFQVFVSVTHYGILLKKKKCDSTTEDEWV